MAYTVVDKGSNYFDTNLYTGNNTARNITLNFSPDFVWIRSRDTGGTNHFLQDSVRGTSKIIYSNLTNAETTFTDGYVSSFNSDGYSLTTDTTGYMNYNARTYVGWSWRGSDSSAVTNTQGTLTTTVSANTTSGFSICKITEAGSYSGVQTFGHGLGVAPSMVIYRAQNTGSNWQVYHKSTGVNITQLNNSGATTSGTSYFPAVSSTTVSIGEGIQAPTYTSIAYCFAEVKGFSKFGGYTGNGNADGTFVYTGFKPAFLIVKESSASGNNWQIGDNKRNGYNVIAPRLEASTSSSEYTNLSWVDFVSNGFKIRSSDGAFNTSSNTYIYMAFAENPFVSSKSIPTTAR